MALRRAELVPRLVGTRALDAKAIGPAAVLARWRMNDGAVLTLAANLGKAAVSAAPPNDGRVLFESATGAAKSLKDGSLPPHTTVALLEPAS